MNNLKTIFYAIVIFLAAIGAFMVFGLIAAAIQYLFILGVLVLGGMLAYKLLKKPDDDPRLEAKRANRELKEMTRKLEEIKRKQFSK